MDEQKRGRGRPKQPWKPFEDELERRLSLGEAEPTMQAEAAYLASWAKQKSIHVSGGAPIKLEAIRNRISKRFNGALGYKNAREVRIEKLKREQGLI